MSSSFCPKTSPIEYSELGIKTSHVPSPDLPMPNKFKMENTEYVRSVHSVTQRHAVLIICYFTKVNFYIYMCVCVCVYTHTNIFISMKFSKTTIVIP